MQHICVIYNPSAGSNDGSKQAIVDAFGSADIKLSFIKLSDTLPEDTRQAQQQGATVLVAAGGDGTVNAVASQAVQLNMPMAVLPVGTLNHFAKDVGLPLDLPQAAAIISSTGSVQRFDYCTVNDRLFVNNSSIGLYPISLLKRERLQPSLGKWPAAIIATLHTAIRLSTTHLQCSVDGQQYTFKTPLLFVGNNLYNFDSTGISNRQGLQDGFLYLYIVRANRLTALLRIAVLLLFGRRTKSKDFMHETPNEIVIHSRKPTLNVSLDGEVMSLPTPLHYTLHSKGLQLYAPLASQKNK